MGQSILVIDDDYFMRKLMEVMLLKDGHTVFIAEDAAEALSTLATKNVEIITCDIMMPEIDGLNFLKQLRADPIFSKIPVIIVTAAGVQQLIKEAIELGASWVIEKPFTEKDLLNAIAKVAA
jgi:two-component system, chemotaxis family, chemotaxis protein CheY